MQRLPIAIIVCHPVAFFKEYDEAAWLKKMAELNTREDAVWYRVMRNLPNAKMLPHLLHVYTAYYGKVQHRTNLADTFRGQDMTFPRPEGGIRTFKSANGIVLGPPFVKAPKGQEFPCKGFQGFRYVYEALF